MHMKFVGALVLAGALAYGQQHTAKTAHMTDHKFATDAAIGGMAEVELGRLAESKASNPDVKNFGKRMVDDHSKANDDLKAVAAKENINLPASLDAKHQAVVDRLSKLSGAEFDRAYVKEMVNDHETDVKEFERESQHGTNAGIKEFASRTLPTLQEHLRMIKDINSKMPSE